MQNEEKRMIIEEALGPFIEESDPEWPDGSPILGGGYESLDIKRLAEQAFAVDCVVEHTFDRAHLYGTQFPMTIIKKGVFVFETLQGHQGREGKALAIIVNTEEDET